VSALISENSKNNNLYVILGVLALLLTSGLTYLLALALPALDAIYIFYIIQLHIFLLLVNHTLNILKVKSLILFSLPLKINRRLNNIVFKISRGLVFFSKKAGEKLEQDFIEFSARLAKAGGIKYKPEELLILLPRCMQNSECKYNVVNNMENCSSCGKCDIKAIRETIAGTGIKAAVVTGGTQARALVKKHNPKMIIAVACERELISGIFDVPACEVIGFINERPEGPCLNTRVSVANLAVTLKNLTK